MLSRKKGYIQRGAIALAAFAVILIISLTAGQAGQFEFNAGDISTADVYAPRAIVDKTTTAALRDAAMKSVQPVYKVDNELGVASVDRLNAFFASATTIRSDGTLDTEAKVLQLKARSKIELDEDCYRAVALMSDAAFSRMKKLTDCVEQVMAEGIEDEAAGAELCAAKIDELGLGESAGSVALALAEAVISVNKTVDEAETESRREAAAAAVVPVEYKKNQTLVRRGEIVTQAQLDMMAELGLLKGSSPLSRRYIAGIILLLLLCFGLIAAYMIICDPELAQSHNKLVIIAIVSVITVAVEFYIGRAVSDVTRFVLPLGLLPAVIAIFADVKIALLVNMCVSVLGAVGAQHEWGYGVCLIVAGSIAAFCYGRVKRRVNLIPAAVISSAGYALTFACMALLETEDGRGIFISLAAGFIGGFLSGILTAGSLPFWEWGFDVLTPMKLNEYSNPESKLLKRLLIQAPGSYHHSLTVANIAEIAAREIGADSVLARVGAYYHDIGKINHPLYFKENQYNENPHDNMQYEDSARAIISHVTDGAAIARQYHLPRGIRDIIVQHHGTTNTGYFLKRALKADPSCDTSPFIYPGPKPQSREAAIVMLCDGCEAAVRSLGSKDEAEIDKMVRSLINSRVESGQLDESGLTFGELKTVTETIIKTLGGYFHERIQY